MGGRRWGGRDKELLSNPRSLRNFFKIIITLIWWESDPKPVELPTSSYSDRQEYTKKDQKRNKRQERNGPTQKTPRVECQEVPWEIRQVLLLLSSECANLFYRRSTGRRGGDSRIGRWVSNHVDQNYELSRTYNCRLPILLFYFWIY